MGNLAKTIAIVAACLVLTSGVASAGSAASSGKTPLPRLPANLQLPFVSVSVPRGPIDFGDVWGPGLRRVEAELVARVVANCPYHVEASFVGFQHESGKVMSPKDMSVAINGKEVAVGNGRVPIARASKPTSTSGVDVPVDLQMALRGLASYPAGRYTGSLVITVMAAP